MATLPNLQYREPCQSPVYREVLRSFRCLEDIQRSGPPTAIGSDITKPPNEQQVDLASPPSCPMTASQYCTCLGAGLTKLNLLGAWSSSMAMETSQEAVELGALSPRAASKGSSPTPCDHHGLTAVALSLASTDDIKSAIPWSLGVSSRQLRRNFPACKLSHQRRARASKRALLLADSDIPPPNQ
ncbi:hypothetical protein ACHAQK_009875 [Fusarium lateritium]